MPRLSNIPTPLIVVTLTAFLGGGLAGAVFSYFANKSKPTLMSYTISSTTIAAAEPASLIPSLKIQVGGKNIKSLYAHNVELTVVRGPYVDEANIAVIFPSDVHIYGMNSGAPSPLHSISCTQLSNGVRCKVSPVAPDTPGHFRIAIATDDHRAPNPFMTGKNITLLSNSELLDQDRQSLIGFLKEYWPLVIITLAYFGAVAYVLKRLRRSRRSRAGSIVVGKILGPDNRPIANAQVEVKVESPASTSQIIHTDMTGDFIAGSLYKEAFFSARIRISHPEFRTSEFQSDSPIIVHSLSRREGQEE